VLNLIFIVIVLHLVRGSILEFEKLKSDPDQFLNTRGLIERKGYPCEDHVVVTEDGYKLTIHRIPFGRNETFYRKRPVAFLQHGLMDASSTWVMNFWNQSLGFMLADANYDVWLGNSRGNTYGRSHVKLNPKHDEFWNFTWTEMARYDLPATINYILKYTGQNDLYYIGHSQGTTIGFAEFGRNKALASKIRLNVALGPVATLGHLISPIKYLADIGEPTNQEIWYDLFGRKDFLPSSTILEWLADKACNNKVTNKLICENLLFNFCGPSIHVNSSRM
jgi:lysosomal acid lipase/cholesteryl ester hydrolase